MDFFFWKRSALKIGFLKFLSFSFQRSFNLNITFTLLKISCIPVGKKLFQHLTFSSLIKKFCFYRYYLKFRKTIFSKIKKSKIVFWISNYCITMHCCHFGSKLMRVSKSKLSVRRNWVCHVVAQPKGNSKHALEYS